MGDCVPLAHPAVAAFELPEDVQDEALAEFHEIVVLLLAGMLEAARVIVGATAVTTSGVALSDTDVAAEVPPRLLQARVKVSTPTAAGVIVCVPLAARVPLQLPEAVQPVAFTDDQVSVVDLATWTDGAANVRVGAAGAVPEVAVKLTLLAAAVPNALLHDNVYAAVPAAVGVTAKLPLAANAPVQLTLAPVPPVATQPVASIVDQVSVVELCNAMVVAARVKVGTTSAVSACTNP